MFRTMLLVAMLSGAVSTPALAAEMMDKAPPPAPYQKVSSLVKLPDFLPAVLNANELRSEFGVYDDLSSICHILWSY